MIAYLLFAAVVVHASANPVSTDKCRPVKDTMLTCLDSTAGDLPKAVNKDIEWLIFTRSNVPVLKKEYLANFPGLTDLHLKDVKLEKIENDAFSNSKALSWVDVSLNKLTTVDPNLFDGCSSMYYFNVSGNTDLVLPKNAPFMNAPQLKWLLLQNTGLTELYPETFTKLTGLKFLSLSDNKLSSIPSDLFKPLKHLTSLDLSRNEFRHLNIDMPTFRTLALYMSDNPWECDCALFPTIEWAKNHRMKDEVTCAKPEKKKWTEITNMNCPAVTVN